MVNFGIATCVGQTNTRSPCSKCQKIVHNASEVKIRFSRNTGEKKYVNDYMILACGGFLKWWYPQIIHFNRDFHYKSSILGYHYFRKPPCRIMQTTLPSLSGLVFPKHDSPSDSMIHPVLKKVFKLIFVEHEFTSGKQISTEIHRNHNNLMRLEDGIEFTKLFVVYVFLSHPCKCMVYYIYIYLHVPCTIFYH